MANKNKKKIIIIIILIVIFICLIVSSKIYVSADEFANKVTIDKAEITSIETGTAPFDKTEEIGNDTSSSDRIVRSFDTIKYNVDFSIKPKENIDVEDLEDRIVEIRATLSDDDIKYASFKTIYSNDDDITISDDKKTVIYKIKDVNTYGDFNKVLELDVKNAPNGYEIKPTFSIKESTDENAPINIGLNKDIINYMPTIVSSKANFDLTVISSNETQIGKVNNVTGRFVTFGIGLKTIGDNKEKGIKGMQIPTGDISFDIEVSQTGNGKVYIGDNYIRPYTSEKINDIESVKMNMPYDIGTNVIFNKKSDNVYTITVKNYNSDFNLVNSDGTIAESNQAIFSTIAVTVFSGRSMEDEKNDIMITLKANPNDTLNAQYLDNTKVKELTLENNTATIKNEYSVVKDYKLSGNFISKNTGVSLSNYIGKDRNYGVVTRGDEIAYKSGFSFENNVLEKTGIINIIKIDPNAFELIKYDKNDYNLTINCPSGKCGITTDDFNVKYVTGEFSKDNFEVVNYDEKSMTESYLDEDVNTIKQQCLNVKNNYENLNSDQLMNLYGGPCLKVKSNTEKVYTGIKDIPNGEKISKIIIETKDNKKLSSTESINFVIGLRIRNINDISKTYQVVALSKSKDEDKTLYFGPLVTNNDASVASYNNYHKTVYKNSVAITDDKSYGDSLKIVNYTASNKINITNKNEDGTKKVSYNTIDNETLNYKIDISTNDNSTIVGSDDVWYIKSLKVTVTLSKYLNFVQNSNYLKPTIINNSDGTTTLVYDLPYTKTNRILDPILFDVKFKQDIKGSDNKVVVNSVIETINANNERYISSSSDSSSTETIYVTAIDGVTITTSVLNSDKKIEKNSEFGYKLDIYNNTSKNVDDLQIVDVIPYNNDSIGSVFDGKYKVKLELPSALSLVKAYCYTGEPSEVAKDIFGVNNKWEECNIKNDYVDATAIKLENININSGEMLDSIIVKIKPKDNEYGNIYNNKFFAKSKSLVQTSSNVSSVNIVNRTISGQVFLDLNQNGVKDDNSYVKGIVTTLCKLDSYNNCKAVSTTETDANGKYVFDKLAVGRYKVNFIYDAELYDVTDRYFTTDESLDSDAYKLSETGKAEISGKLVSIKVTKDIEKLENLDMGLVSRKNFEVEIKKGINNIELSNNGLVNSYKYNFEKTVALNVKKPSNLTGKVVYGFTVENNTSSAGYVKLIEEMIPDGMSFNPNYEENKDWFSVEGNVYYDGLKDTLLKPSETKTFQIALDINPRNEAGTFLNQVSVAELETYEEEISDREDDEYKVNNFELGSKITYGGVDFNVINDDGENVTLLSSAIAKLSHLRSGNNSYKWSTSIINTYLNNSWLNNTSIDSSILVSKSICDDASGLEKASFGGTLKEENTCQSGIYNNYKVRLLTTNEFETLISKLDDISFLTSTANNDYWLMNSSYIPLDKDEFGEVINSTSKNAMYVKSGTTSVLSGDASIRLAVRPVITVPKANILVE